MRLSRVPDRSCRIATGTYTGDGATSKAITGVGFTPKYVKIARRSTADGTLTRIVEAWTDVVDDNAAGGALAHIGAGEHHFVTDAIISLDADGFTVDDKGTDADPNTNGATYNYLCLG